MNRYALLVVAVSACAPTAAVAAIRTVALTGQAAPGAPAGAVFAQVSAPDGATRAPVINNSGRTAFGATLTVGAGDVTTSNDAGIWSEGVGALALAAREGSTTAGLPAGVLIHRLSHPVINAAGQIGFNGVLTGAGVSVSNNDAVWTSAAGAVSVLAREGAAAPGTPAGVTFGGVNDIVLNDGPHAVFRGLLNGPGVGTANRGFWEAGPGGTRLVARLEDQAPGMPTGVKFDFFFVTSPLINSAGQVAFRALAAGPGVTTANDAGIWIERGGALRLVARDGGPAPRLPAPIVFGQLGDPSINRQGDVVFSSTLAGQGVGLNNQSLWVDRAGSLQMVAREGDAAQGSIIFSTFGNAMINALGDVAFIGDTTGWGGAADTRGGIWAKSSDGAWRVVAAMSTQYDALPAGVVHGGLGGAVLNNAGQVAFLSALTGTEVTTANDRALWVEGLDNEVRLVAREGDSLEVAPGVSRTISTIEFVGGVNNEQGSRSGLNDRGEVAFQATFTDGTSGVFVSDVGVPLASDFNGDDAIDGADLLIWQRNVGRTDTGASSNGDANFDGDVNAGDLAEWRARFRASQAAVTATPEPGAGTLAILAAACGAATAGRRRKRAFGLVA